MLGVGFTDQHGTFRITFTRSEFNQEWLEMEQTPDIYVVCSYQSDEQFYAVHQQSFYDLDLKATQYPADLGLISIDVSDKGNFTVLPDVDPTPGYRKKVKRLNLDNELLRYAIEDVAPLVETLTGWRNLLDNDLTVVLTSDFRPYMKELEKLRNEISQGNSWLDMINDLIFKRLNNVLALYDPYSHTIAVNEQEMAYHNLDALKVVLGHELVHVGQFQYASNALKERTAGIESMARLFAKIESGDIPLHQLVQRIGSSSFMAHMTRIEGYAHYIQKDFLEKQYNMATFFEHPSILAIVISGFMTTFMPELLEGFNLKGQQYEQGADIFRRVSTGTHPTKFSIN
jgi:hypothetical protein